MGVCLVEGGVVIVAITVLVAIVMIMLMAVKATKQNVMDKKTRAKHPTTNAYSNSTKGENERTQILLMYRSL